MYGYSLQYIPKRTNIYRKIELKELFYDIDEFVKYVNKNLKEYNYEISKNDLENIESKKILDTEDFCIYVVKLEIYS